MAALDQYANNAAAADGPSGNFAMTAADANNDLPFVTRCIMAPTAGSITVLRADGQSVTIPVVAGQVLPIRIARFVSGSGVTQILAMY